MSEEFLPFLVGGGAVFVGGAQGAAAGEEGQVGLDDLVGIDGLVVQRDVDVLVSSDDLGDVWRQPDENGIGQEQAAKVMRGEEQRPACCVDESGLGQACVEHSAGDPLADGALLADDAADLTGRAEIRSSTEPRVPTQTTRAGERALWCGRARSVAANRDCRLTTRPTPSSSGPAKSGHDQAPLRRSDQHRAAGGGLFPLVNVLGMIAAQAAQAAHTPGEPWLAGMLHAGHRSAPDRATRWPRFDRLSAWRHLNSDRIIWPRTPYRQVPTPTPAVASLRLSATAQRGDC